LHEIETNAKGIAEKENTPILTKKDTWKGVEAISGVIIHKSTKKPGQYQLTTWDEQGFSGDTHHQTKTEAIQAALSQGYNNVDPESFKRISKTDGFQAGNEAAEETRKWNQEHYKKYNENKAKIESEKPSVKEPWEMRTGEYELVQRDKRPGTYGDWYFTPGGDYVQMQGSGGMGSKRVKTWKSDGSFAGHYNQEDLRLAKKTHGETDSAKEVTIQVAEKSARIDKLRDDNGKALMSMGLYETFKNKSTPEEFQRFQEKGTVISDEEYADFQKLRDEIDAIRDEDWRVPQDSVHKQLVEKAINEGKPVPPEVLAEYPDLQNELVKEFEQKSSQETAETEERLKDLSEADRKLKRFYGVFDDEQLHGGYERELKQNIEAWVDGGNEKPIRIHGTPAGKPYKGKSIEHRDTGLSPLERRAQSIADKTEKPAYTVVVKNEEGIPQYGFITESPFDRTDYLDTNGFSQRRLFESGFGLDPGRISTEPFVPERLSLAVESGLQDKEAVTPKDSAIKEKWMAEIRFYYSGGIKNAELPDGQKVILSKKATPKKFLNTDKVFIDKLWDKKKDAYKALLAKETPPPANDKRNYPLDYLPEFQKWFGSSKVTDSEGYPLRVFHGTTETFDTFDPEKGELGIHFGSANVANDRVQSFGRKFVEDSRILPVYVSLENPYDVGSDLGDWNDMGMLKEYLTEGNEGPFTDAEFSVFKTSKDVRQGLLAKGFDGMQYENRFEPSGDDSEECYIAFKADQIKSVFEIDNKKSFAAPKNEDSQNPAWQTPLENYIYQFSNPEESPVKKHKMIVHQALLSGKLVPQEVMSDYPHFAYLKQLDYPNMKAEDQGLFDALHSTVDASDRWGQLITQGLTDSELKERIGSEFGTLGFSTDNSRSITYKGKTTSSFSFKSEIEGQKDIHYELKGLKLITKVREILDIPVPVVQNDIKTLADPKKKGSQKKVWQTPLKDYLHQMLVGEPGKFQAQDRPQEYHKMLVRQVLLAGQSVPQKVMSDYPHFAYLKQLDFQNMKDEDRGLFDALHSIERPCPDGHNKK
jgi:hypothetical protein